ncbi:hypothetical protein EJ08DRAFT_704226 [Tothia fuscella]|uniref:Mid2 domain-containing protein n=1 Tax=Tothia fuscella TaxID=1048955 RepID=A0A9P4P3K7_9PEZI|nr:hypothetical protein EJ08DRAFT_704226 [Tothia fuscella]
MPIIFPALFTLFFVVVAICRADQWTNPPAGLDDLSTIWFPGLNVRLTWNLTKDVDTVTIKLRHWLASDVILATLLDAGDNKGYFNWKVGEKDNVDENAIGVDSTFVLDLIDPTGTVGNGDGWINNTLSSHGFVIRMRDGASRSSSSTTASTSQSSTSSASSTSATSTTASTTSPLIGATIVQTVGISSPGPTQTSDGLDTATKIGLGIGLGIGIPILVLLTIATTCVMLQRRRRIYATHPRTDVYEKETASSHGDKEPITTAINVPQRNRSSNVYCPVDIYGNGRQTPIAELP